MRVYAVGDIHGELALLRQVLDFISADAARAAGRGKRAVAVFLGDYVDRGDDSRGVVDVLSQLGGDAPEWVFLAGNHEAKLLAFLDNPQQNQDWLDFGGLATLASYGVLMSPGMPRSRRLADARKRFAAEMPQRHLHFLKSLETSKVIGDYFFAHAGIRPGVPLEAQSAEDLMWIRDEFTEAAQWHGKKIVHGHTITDEPDLRPWRVGIDTGAYATGRLCCMVLEDDRVDFVFPAGPDHATPDATGVKPESL